MSAIMINSPPNKISKDDALFLDRIRGLSIFRVVLVHLGLSWIYPPYSQFFHVFLPVLFFVSGAVSFFSFKRAPSLSNYITRRLLSTVIPFYVIVVVAFVYVWLSQVRIPSFELNEIIDWVLIRPAPSDMPFPLGQVWFIHAITIMHLAAVPVFMLSRNSVLPLFFVIMLSVGSAIANQFYEISQYFNFSKLNIYHALSYFSFFIFGAFYYSKKQFFSNVWIALLAAVCLVLLVFNVLVLKVDVNMAVHGYSPDSYLIAGAFLAIFVVLLCKPLIDYLLNKFKMVDWFFLFFSRHSYSIFILHSLMIYLVETKLGLIDVARDPVLAITKVFIVIVATCVIAVPVSKISKGITNMIQGLLLKGDSLKSTKIAENV